MKLGFKDARCYSLLYCAHKISIDGLMCGWVESLFFFLITS